MHGTRKLFGVAATIAVLWATSASNVAAGPSPSPSAGSPAIKLSVSSGTPGTQLAVTGSGFPATALIGVTLDESCCLSKGSSDSLRAFIVVATISPSAVGPHEICANTGYPGNPQPSAIRAKACSQFVVEPFKPTITLSVYSGVPGTHLPITGSGFPAGSVVALYVDSPTYNLSTPGPFADALGNMSSPAVIRGCGWNGGCLEAGPHQVCGDAIYVGNGPPQSADAKACVEFTLLSPASTPTSSPPPAQSSLPSPTPTPSPLGLAASNSPLAATNVRILTVLGILILMAGAGGSILWGIRRRRL